MGWTRGWWWWNLLLCDHATLVLGRDLCGEECSIVLVGDLRHDVVHRRVLTQLLHRGAGFGRGRALLW